MTQSSIPDAIDYLVSQAQAAAVGTPTVVSDGWNTGALQMFAVGADRPPVSDSGEQSTGAGGILTLGQAMVEERYGIPCWVYAASGGTQKECRDAVFTLWNAFIVLVRADLSLGGALQPGPAQISQFRLEGPKTADEAGSGRYALLMFTVTCLHLY